VTQANAASAEQTAAASQELSSQSHLLMQIIEDLNRLVSGAAVNGAGRSRAGMLGDDSEEDEDAHPLALPDEGGRQGHRPSLRA
jgi:hypothetical protein